MNALFIQQDRAPEARAAPLRLRIRLRAALLSLWRAYTARRRIERDLAWLQAVDDRMLSDIGVDRRLLRRVLTTGVLPPLCTTFEPERDK